MAPAAVDVSASALEVVSSSNLAASGSSLKMKTAELANRSGPSRAKDVTDSNGHAEGEHEEEQDAVGTLQPPPRKRARWEPRRFLEPPTPPPPYNRGVEQEAAFHQAAFEAGLEPRRMRKFSQRRTVDYFGSMALWDLRRTTATNPRMTHYLKPSPHYCSDLLPPAAYTDPSSNITTICAQTAVNKIKCAVNVARWMPDGRRVLTGSSSGEFTLWNGFTFNFETILQAHDSPIRSMQWSHSGVWLISSDQNGQIKYYQQNMNNVQAFEGHRESVRALSFSPDDGRFCSVSDDQTVKVWVFDQAREERVMTGHGWDVICCDWHPTKGLIVTGSKDNLVKFWDPRSGSDIGTYHGHKNSVQACRWSPDGNYVATASRDQMVKIYDLRALSDIYTMKGHKKDVCSVAWHPVQHDLLVSGGFDGSLHFWSTSSNTPETALHVNENAHDAGIWTMSWNPIGHILVTGSADFSTKFWSRARPGGGDGKANEEREEGGLAMGGIAANSKRVGEWGGAEDFIPGFTSNLSNTAPLAGGGGGPDMSSFTLPGLGAGNRPPGPPPPMVGMGGHGGYGGGPGVGAGLMGGGGGPSMSASGANRAPPPGGLRRWGAGGGGGGQPPRW
ncbi:pre-mRNA cleavage and polyadenylation factor (CPF) complex subunit [Tilletia horrida]|uniref:Polyadenylation factor subunit 2 n=1 Tax=Tilletia horrida TaxID=155126 RepID=A0AAN6GD41_9BASI|nr:pre-mRNA cleavage and polyadenylation factor (CPF) complex subunit [Tilletia horrida]